MPTWVTCLSYKHESKSALQGEVTIPIWAGFDGGGCGCSLNKATNGKMSPLG